MNIIDIISIVVTFTAIGISIVTLAYQLYIIAKQEYPTGKQTLKAVIMIGIVSILVIVGCIINMVILS